MVLAETLICFFVMAVAGGFLALRIKRNAVFYSIVSTSIFLINCGYSLTIPFKVNSTTGALELAPANIVLFAMNFLFFSITLIITIRDLFEFFG